MNTKTSNKNDKRIYMMSQEKPVKAVLGMGLPLIAGMILIMQDYSNK